MKRKGIKELARSTKGNTYMAVGRITNHRVVGCPPCDTLYLQLTRDGHELIFIGVTPEEAEIISNLMWKAILNRDKRKD